MVLHFPVLHFPPSDLRRLVVLHFPTVALFWSSFFWSFIFSKPDLGVYIDADLSMCTHVATTVGAHFAALRHIPSQDTLCYHWSAHLLLARSITVTRFWPEYPGNLICWLQSVMNASTHLVFSAKRSDHITPLFCELHWVKVPEKIQFRLDVLAYRCVHNTALEICMGTTVIPW